LRLARLQSSERLLPLMRRQLSRSTKPDAKIITSERL
jgi:hypothetical protein